MLPRSRGAGRGSGPPTGEDPISASSASDGKQRSPRGTGRRLRGAIAQYLGIAILSGEIAPGERLSTEIDHAEALNISRGAYREAVQVLTAKGLVESRPKAGTHVLPRARWSLLDPDVLGWAFSGEPDPGYVRDLFELRAAIEPAAARLAAERHTRDDIKAMRDALARMRRSTLANEAGRAADRDFHGAILQATHNDVFVTLSASIGAAVNLTTQYKQRTRALPRDPIPDHARVCDAIAAGDAAAAGAAMTTLVDLALQDTNALMTGRPEPA